TVVVRAFPHWEPLVELPVELNGSAKIEQTTEPATSESAVEMRRCDRKRFRFILRVFIVVPLFCFSLDLFSFRRGTAGNPARYNAEILDFLERPAVPPSEHYGMAGPDRFEQKGTKRTRATAW